MKNDFVMPIVVLALICVVISGALAFTNSITEPVIASAAAEREEAARYEMIPEADNFESVVIDGLPPAVREVFRSTNNVGHIFVVTASGYGGEMTIICGIAPDGRLIKSKALQQTETKGLGSKITEAPFMNQFDGMDSRLDGLIAITGATISSEAYTNAIRDAFEAFELVNR